MVMACVVFGCGGGQGTNVAREVTVAKPEPEPQDLFEPLRQPYKDAVRASRAGDQLATRRSIRAMLTALERARTARTGGWPAPYDSEPELTTTALELLINQTKVVGALSLTGQSEEAYTTLMDLGGVLQGVRKHLGVARPTDLLIGVYQQLEGIETALASGQIDWRALDVTISLMFNAIGQLRGMSDEGLPEACQSAQTWATFDALNEAAARGQQTPLYESWLDASRAFPAIFELCG